MTNAVVHTTVQFDFFAYILERLSDGTVDKIERTEIHELGFELDVLVDGEWYHIAMKFTPTGGYSA